jgi:hypothetical protein
MAKKRYPYEELKRYMMAFTLFVFSVAVLGMAASGSRVFTIVYSGFAIIVSLQLACRIIIWVLATWEGVKNGAEEGSKKAS